MANVVLVLLVLFLAWYIGSIVRRGGRGIVARRGMSIGADLAALADKPRVRVETVTKVGPDRVRLVLRPEAGPDDGPSFVTSSDLDLVVFLDEGAFGFDLLHQWKRSESSLAIVMPPDSRIMQLRSVDDLQPLTLRRADEG